MEWTLLVDTFTKKLQKLVGHYGVNFILVWLTERAGDLSLVFLQIDNFFFDNEFFRVPREEIFEFLDMLSRDVPHFRWGLRSVTQEALDRNLCACSILPAI